VVRRFHRSKRAAPYSAALALALGTGACSRDASVTTRAVTLHVPAACAVGPSAYAQYFELGDFEPGAPTGGHVLGRPGEVLPEVGSAARALLVEATESSRTWSGTATLPPAGQVDALVTPMLLSCPFSTRVGARTGSAVAAIAGDRVLVVGGDQAAPTFVASLDTGRVAAARPDLLTPRQGASVTPFGSGGLVAGGADPRSGGQVLATAEVFAPDPGGFDQQHAIALSTPRMDHGAVVLVTGETLLAGGVGSKGGRDVHDSMEAIDPITREVRSVNVARLQVARRAPSLLRLASGEILVAGGLDASGAPVATVEWLAPDASRATRVPRDLVAGSARAFVALDGGGALAVVAPPAGAPADFQSVWVIGADGAFEAATPLGGSLLQPVLFHGAGGEPVLWTGGAGGRWLRWQPWQAAFAALGVLDETPARVGAASTSPDPGLALWLDDASAPALVALRFDARGPYSPVRGPLLADSAADTMPDRLAAPGVASFDPSSGLALGPGASAFVTDRTYADVAIDVDAPTGEPALIVLRDELGGELEVGGIACPGALAKAAAGSSLHVQRTGGTVRWAVAGGAQGACPSGVRAAARLSVGVRAPAGAARSVARSLRITRLGP
jgi:hypothetical protein